MKKILIAAMMTVVAAAAIPGMAYAKHGADDPADHVRGEGARHR